MQDYLQIPWIQISSNDIDIVQPNILSENKYKFRLESEDNIAGRIIREAKIVTTKMANNMV